jgi:eukaryotic-like serine/threonine-protein kinase
LRSVAKWDPETLEEFARFIRSDQGTVGNEVFYLLDADTLRSLHAKDQSLWTSIALKVCEWAYGSFDFDYCDVVVGRLETIYELGNIECRANAVLAAASLGASHNRWYVMRRLLGMCGPTIEERLATRIAIQIQIEEAERDFIRSVEQLDRSLSVYHPRIAAMLST